MSLFGGGGIDLSGGVGGLVGDLPGGEIFSSLLGGLGGLFDSGPKLGTQMVRAYESGRSPFDAANLLKQSGGDPEKAEQLRTDAGWNGGIRSADATARDCGAFSLWLGIAYGVADMGSTTLPSRCAEKQHADELDRIFGGSVWRQELNAIYQMLAVRDPRALDLIDQHQRTLGVSVVNLSSVRSFLNQAASSAPPAASNPPIYTGSPAPSPPAPTYPSSGQPPTYQPAPALSANALLPIALLLLLLK